MVEQNIKEYNKYNLLGTLFSGLLVLHVVTKFLFNIFAEIKLPFDKWTRIDIVTAFLNILCFNYIGNVTVD